jgi:hypothetical protein
LRHRSQPNMMKVQKQSEIPEKPGIGWEDGDWKVENVEIYRWNIALYQCWLVVWNMNGLFFPSYWECHHPNWRSPSFFRGVSSTTNQPLKIPSHSNPIEMP